jgi:hypothetical protein
MKVKCTVILFSVTYKTDRRMTDYKRVIVGLGVVRAGQAWVIIS